jgi:spore coat polysaccharide biosynthesis protein SpsF (cytidylyltransferase family)
VTRVAAIIQARLGSSRLPGKAMMDVGGRPLLERVITRARAISGIDVVVVATTTLDADRKIVTCARALGAEVFQGADEDVLDRVHCAATHLGAEVVVRLTADCPLLDPDVSGQVVALFGRSRVDYASNTHPPTYPDGLDTEVFTAAALARAWREAKLPSERAHVTPYIWKHPELFPAAYLERTPDLSAHRWTVDEAADLDFVRAVYGALESKHGPCFSYDLVIELVNARPDIQRLASRSGRNEGYAMSVRQDHDS